MKALTHDMHKINNTIKINFNNKAINLKSTKYSNQKVEDKILKDRLFTPRYKNNEEIIINQEKILEVPSTKLNIRSSKIGLMRVKVNNEILNEKESNISKNNDEIKGFND